MMNGRHGAAAAAKETGDDSLSDRSATAWEPVASYLCQARITTRLCGSEDQLATTQLGSRVGQAEPRQDKRPEQDDDEQEEMQSEEVAEYTAGYLAKRVRKVEQRVDIFQLRIGQSIFCLQFRPDEIPRVAMQVQNPTCAAGQCEYQPPDICRSRLASQVANRTWFSDSPASYSRVQHVICSCSAHRYASMPLCSEPGTARSRAAACGHSILSAR